MGVTLPPDLQPWADELAALPIDIALSLGPYVQRLASAVGPLSAPPVTGDGEPDGFDGLSRRGEPDRMLLSEWALAEDVPLEFLRRAADRELSYLRLRRVDPGSSRRTVVWLDTGPSQHGEPRLMHLAALVVLARRARLAQAELAWGPLGGELCSEPLSERTLKAWRKVRSHAPTPQELELEAEQDDDLWVIGGDEVAAGPGTRLVVREAIDPEHRELEAELHRGGIRRLRFPLPEPDRVIRLIRAVGRPSSRSWGTVDPGPVGNGWLRISSDGNRLVIADTTSIVALHIPHSPQALAKTGVGRTRRWDHPNIVAAGHIGRTLLGVGLEDDALVLADGTRCTIPQDYAPPHEPTWCAAAGREIQLRDADGRGFSLPAGTTTYLPDLLPRPSQVHGHIRDRTFVCKQPPHVFAHPLDFPVIGALVDDDRAVGVAWDPHEIHLIPLEGDYITLMRAGDDPLVQVVCSPVRPQIAFRRESGRVEVLDLRDRTTLLKVGP